MMPALSGAETQPLSNPSAPQSSSDSDESVGRPLDRWLPGVALSAGMRAVRLKGSAASTDVMGPPDPLLAGSPLEIRPILGNDEDPVRTATIAVSFELMTPALAESFGAPRLFLDLGVGPEFGQTTQISKEGSPGTLRLPVIPGDPNFPFAEADVVGQGTVLEAQQKGPLATAALGAAFSFGEILEERVVRVKPSVEVLLEQMTLKGTLRRAIALTNPLRSDADYRSIELIDKQDELFLAVGPRIEIEADVARAGPVTASIFAGGSVYWFVGDRSVELSATNEFGESATFRFEHDPWGYRVVTGIRFRFSPED